MAEEHKVKAVLNIGGEINSTLKGAFSAITGNIGNIGKASQKAIKGQLGKAINDAKSEITKLNSELKQTGADTVKIGAALEATRARLASAKSANDLYYSIGSAAHKFAVGLATVTAEATASGWAIYHMTEKYENYLKTVRIGAKMNDMTAQNFARISYMAGDEEKTSAFMKARALFSKANFTGTKQYQGALATVGLSQSDLKGLTLTEGMFKVGDALKNYKGDKEALAKIFFGKGGQQVMPILMRGSEENRKRMGEADKLGLAPTDEDIAKNAEYAHVMEQMRGSVLGVKLAIGKAMLPAIERVGETITNFMIKHHDEFAVWATKIGSSIERNLPAMEELESVAHRIGAAFEFAERHTTLAKIALGALVTLPFLPFISALLQIGVAIKTLGGVEFILAIGGLVKGLWGTATAALAVDAALLPVIGTAMALAVAIGSVVFAIKQLHDNWNDLGALGSLDTWKGMAKNLTGQGGSMAPPTTAEIAAYRKANVKTNAPHPSALPSPEHGRRGNTIMPSPSSSLAAPTTTHNNVTVHVHASPGMDEHALAKKIAAMLEKSLTGGSALYDGHYA